MESVNFSGCLFLYYFFSWANGVGTQRYYLCKSANRESCQIGSSNSAVEEKIHWWVIRVNRQFYPLDVMEQEYLVCCRRSNIEKIPWCGHVAPLNPFQNLVWISLISQTIFTYPLLLNINIHFDHFLPLHYTKDKYFCWPSIILSLWVWIIKEAKTWELLERDKEKKTKKISTFIFPT